MDLALYHPEYGYYLSSERKPGRGGDFLTSPEASPFFGITLAEQVADCWERLDRPANFSIREYGSGVGALAYDILAGLADGHPECFESTTYRLAERNRHRQAEALTAFRDVGLIDRIVDESDTTLHPITGVVLANEVADAFPAHRMIRADGAWTEAWVIATTDGFRFEEASVSDDGRKALEQVQAELTEIPDGVYDVSPAATAWFQHACNYIERGYAVVIDYGYGAQKLHSGHRLEGTLRAYREHTVSDNPFDQPGMTDLTAHVDFSALIRAGEASGASLAGLTTQGALLSSLGLGERLLKMQSDPELSLPDYMSAQSVVLRLIDPGGLGRFGVLILARNAPIDPPLRGFNVPPPPF
jgi:SAM-dependent MidA family methyltransferase